MNKSLVLEEFTRRCRKNNLKITPQREAIYRILLTLKNHPSADQVHGRLRVNYPHISLDTVNRTLQTFARIGLIQTVEGSGEPRRYDPDRTAHHHLKCIQCETIVDFHDNDYNHLKIPQRISSRYRVVNKKVILEIICDSCLEQN